MRRRNQRGTQILELALVLPLLVFMAMGVIEGGSLVRVHQLVNNSAREGARLGATQTVSEAANRDAIVQQAVQSYLTNNNLVPSANAGFTLGQCSAWSAPQNVAIKWPDSPNAITGTVTINGTPVTVAMTQVTVTCPYKFTFLPSLPSLGIYPVVILKGSTTLTALNGG